MSYADWKVGDRVVCVDDSDGLEEPNNGRLKLGSIYVLKNIDCYSFCEPAVQVDGLGLRWWEFLKASRFRKVQPRKTSIAVFEALLRPQPQTAE